MNVVSATVRTWRWRLAVTYGLAVVENTFELLYPFAIGPVSYTHLTLPTSDLV